MSFVEKGYTIFDLSEASTALIRECTDEWGGLDMIPDGDINEFQAEGRDALCKLPRSVVELELDFFRNLMGADLHIQREPFLRIARPGRDLDNIGYHRDTWYGDTPYEVSVWFPLTDTIESNALRVAPGSHLWPEHEWETEVAGRTDVERGSLKHSLGFVVGQKKLRNAAEMVPLPVRVGQCIVFSLSLLHGQEVNQSPFTRVSMDVRVANSWAPIRWSRSRDPNYYEPLCVSPLTQAARKYAEANAS